MKPDYWDAVWLVVIIVISLAIITIFNLEPTKNKVEQEARRLAEYQVFCLEQSKRLPLVWDDDQGCIVIDRDARASRERRN